MKDQAPFIVQREEDGTAKFCQAPPECTDWKLVKCTAGKHCGEIFLASSSGKAKSVWLSKLTFNDLGREDAKKHGIRLKKIKKVPEEKQALEGEKASRTGKAEIRGGQQEEGGAGS